MEYLKLTYLLPAAVLYTNSTHVTVSRCNTAAGPNKLLATDGIPCFHWALKVEVVLCSAAAPSTAAWPAAARFCWHQLLWRKAAFGISTGKCRSARSTQRTGTKFQWTSEKVNLRRGVSPGATAAALGQMQSRTSVILPPYETKAKIFSICPHQLELFYLHPLLCPKTFIDGYLSYGHRNSYSCYM